MFVILWIILFYTSVAGFFCGAKTLVEATGLVQTASAHIEPTIGTICLITSILSIIFLIYLIPDKEDVPQLDNQKLWGD